MHGAPKCVRTAGCRRDPGGHRECESREGGKACRAQPPGTPASGCVRRLNFSVRSALRTNGATRASGSEGVCAGVIGGPLGVAVGNLVETIAWPGGSGWCGVVEGALERGVGIKCG